MVPRVWTCVEPPLPLRLLALPIHPLVVLVFFALAFAGLALGRDAAGRKLLRLGAVMSIGLAGTVILFGLSVLALATNGMNPTPVLRFLPWASAITGPLAMGLGWSKAGAASSLGLNSVSARPRIVGQEVSWLGVATSVGLALVIGLRCFVIDNNWPYASAPYRLMEFFITDQLDTVASDECLAARALEYGPYDLSVKRPARELDRRGLGAVAGVVALMERTRAHWPPEPHTVSPDGMRWAIQYLREHGEGDVAARWDGVDWKRDLLRANAKWTPSLRDSAGLPR